MSTNVKKALEALESAKKQAENLPAPVDTALKELGEAIKQGNLPWYKKLVYKNGEFSKTAAFASIANVMILVIYLFESLFAGMVVGGPDQMVNWTVPVFDVTAASAILAIMNGAYLGNNALKRGQ